jgi:hypothetical protein
LKNAFIDRLALLAYPRRDALSVSVNGLILVADRAANRRD